MFARCIRRFLLPSPQSLSSRPGIAAVSTTADSSISPVLLRRARSIAEEHTKLANQNAENYDVATAKKIGELSTVTAALAEWDNAQNSIKELNSLLLDPTSDSEIRSLASEDVEATSATVPRLISLLKRSLIPPHPFASLPCLLEIHPGAGGSEASLFAAELLHMYTTFCANKGWKTELVKYEADESAPGSEEGLTDAVLEVTQPGSYNMLKGEAGVHRVQRVPATEKKGRTHTSAVSVLVLPSLPAPGSAGIEDTALNFEDPNSDYYINSGEVRAETMRARGAGGQHVNKTDSAVRLTHVPTGITVAMQESRSQHKNREKAWQILRAKLAQKRREERENELIDLRRKIMGGVSMTGREDKVRTYNYSQQRVTDHRCGSETGSLPDVLEGGQALERIMRDVGEWMQEQEVAVLAAEEEVKASDLKSQKGGRT
ncbi:hypothetical protein GJ744_000325 [Endocarpon pusillum]|uniref:Prokaryotic-type class I peptide chain release factors domain-containing protein n=1 Tax=Endocarpon pusillum TaxID=364733 RepID=A0A8H7E932_9EURO|nr:hypothetical protein GJ744_000325 [Endocarpon pusillum]